MFDMKVCHLLLTKSKLNRNAHRIGVRLSCEGAVAKFKPVKGLNYLSRTVLRKVFESKPYQYLDQHYQLPWFIEPCNQFACSPYF